MSICLTHLDTMQWLSKGELVVEKLYEDETGDRTIWRWRPSISGRVVEHGEETEQRARH